MARDLYATEAAFRDAVDECAELFREPLGLDLRQVLFPDSENPAAAEELEQTALAQPALFTVEWALSRLWQEWGIEPKALLGHSIGELTAACVAGVFSLQDAVAAVALRGRLMQQMEPGTMLSVAAGEEDLPGELPGEAVLAVVNSPKNVVLSVPLTEVEALESWLAARGLEHRRLHTSHAFHSPSMEPALEPFRQALESLTLAPPRIPLLSNVSGTWMTTEDATSPAYWARQLRSPVRFAAGLEALLADEDLLLLEVGPGEVLTKLVRGQAPSSATVVASLPGPRRAAASSDPEALATVLGALGRLWQAGADVDWAGFIRGEVRRRVAVPTYAFQRRRYLVEPQAGATLLSEAVAETDPGKWFYLPSWKRGTAALLGPAAPPETGRLWLLFLDSRGLGAELLEQLRQRGERLVTVSAGDRFARLADGTFALDPADPEDYRQLFKALGEVPGTIVHLWAFGTLEDASRQGALDHWRRFTFDSLVALGKTLAPLIGGDGEVSLAVVSSGLHRIDDRDALEPFKALLLGACRVLQQEHPALGCKSLDLELPPRDRDPGLARLVLQELAAAKDDLVVAYRSGSRWVEAVEPLPVAAPSGVPWRLRPDGTVLITGGLGGVGLALARALVARARSRLVLVGRSAFPPPEDWARYRAAHGEEDAVARRIRRLQELQEMGSRVQVFQADVADRSAMAQVFLSAERTFGRIDGIIHAAGLVGQGMACLMAELEADDLTRQLRPKVQGLMVLEELLAGRDVDFLAVTSSTSALLGGLGLSAYAAASLCVDALVREQADLGKPWMSLNWDGWSFESEGGSGGEAGGDTGGDAGAGGARGPAWQVPSLSETTGGDAFLRALDLAPGPEACRLLIAPRPLEPLMDRWLRRSRLRAAATAAPASGGGYERPRHLSTAYRPPSTDSERQLAKIWQVLLGIEEVGVDDDFFELGGHSLLATQVLAKVRDELGVRLGLEQIFETPTIARLALVLEDSGGVGTGLRPPAVKPVDRSGALPLSFAQERMWLLYRFDPKGTAYNLPAGIELRGELSVQALARTYDAVVQRHEILRTRFREEGGRPVQEVLAGGDYRLPVVDLQALEPGPAEQEKLRLTLEQGRQPFDLSAGKLFRNALLRLEPRRHVFLSACHHIVTDGWSGGLSVAEVAVLYPAFVAGEPPPLPALPLQYGDFAAWQRGWLQGTVLDELVDFWRARLGDRPVLAELPLDRGRSASGRRAARTSFRLGAGPLAALRSTAQRLDASLFMATMAGIVAWLHRYTGADDLTVGTAAASRHVPGTEDLLGVFINTLVLRCQDIGSATGAELMKKVRKAGVEAFAHQDLPFDKLVEALSPARDVHGQTLFRVMVAFNHEPPPTPHLPGLELEIVDLGERDDEAMFDLSLGLTDEGEVLTGSVQYNSSLFDASTVERWMGHLLRLLEALGSGSLVPVAKLPLLSAAEHHQLVTEWGTWGGQVAGFEVLAVEKILSLRVESSYGQVQPVGVWGQVVATAREGARVRSQEAPAGRFSATGELLLRVSEDEAPERPPAEAALNQAEEGWREVAERKSSLSSDKQRLLQERLAGRRRAPRRTVSTPSVAETLVSIQPLGDRLPLFCVHAVAGDVTSYVELAEHLDPDQPFFGLQAPGLIGGQAPFSSLEAMAAHYVKAVRRVRPSGPYLLGGWSMGAVVSYEMAQQLRRQDLEVALVVMLEPAVPGQEQRTAAEAGIASLIEDLEDRLGRRLSPHWREAVGPGPERQARYLLRLARESGFLEAGLGAGDSPQLLQVYEANVAALQSYHPEPYGGDVVLVTVEHGPEREGLKDARTFWRQQAGRGVTVHHVEGNHTTMLRKPHVRSLAEVLNRCLLPYRSVV
jgi:thioesterase domain-containing protein/malonyl CoA-acyl carrier protein transacylase